jgi:hypothetical protein
MDNQTEALMTFDKEQAFIQAGNVVRFFEAAQPDEIQGGLVWYSDVRTQALEWASEYAVSIKQVAAVIAVLSPNTPWTKNLEYALNAVAYFRYVDNHMGLFENGVRTFYGNIKKAYKILVGEDFGQVRGRKVQSFWDNIWRVDSLAVTHDVHSRRVVFNDTLLPANSISKKDYNTATMAYRLAHTVIQEDTPEVEHPYQLQAITWGVARRLRNEGVQTL